MKDSSILLKYAINYLSKFSSSKSNLEKILKNKIRRLQVEKKEKFELYNLINPVIEQLEKNNFINDFNYCLSKCTLLIEQGKSKIYITSYLFQKGISKEIIRSIFEKIEIEKPNWELVSAKIFVRKKRLLNNQDQKEKNLAKMARAGFNYELAKKVIAEN